jgi:hypothetical protein
LLKNTEDNGERSILNGAVSKISSVVDFINEKKRIAENKIKLAQIQMLVDDAYAAVLVDEIL